MNLENRISLKIDKDDVRKIKEAIKTLQRLLSPHLVPLSSDDRKQLPKLGSSHLPFVDIALETAKANPNLAPPYVNIDELRVDLEAVELMNGLIMPLEQITSDLSDSLTLAGSEAYVSSLAIYNTVKRAEKMGVTGSEAHL